MRKIKLSKESWKRAREGVCAVAALIFIIEYLKDTHPLYELLILIGYYGSILYLIVPAVFELIQGMTPANRFKHLYLGLVREQQNTNNDGAILWPDTGRTLDNIYRDREQLSSKLRKFRIFAPDPWDPKNWIPFIQGLIPLSKEGKLDEARRRYGDPKQFRKPSD